MTDPRPYHHGDLHAALLMAAEVELTERGVEAFSLRAVARRAGVSHAAPAHHFTDVTGLLTALATEGFRSFLATQHAREALATAALDRLEAAGLGYVDFARQRPALFRLIFSSNRPDFTNTDLCTAADAAFDHLVDLVTDCGGDHADVRAVWAVAHGTADLMAGGRLKSLLTLPTPAQDAAIRDLMRRALAPLHRPVDPG